MIPLSRFQWIAAVAVMVLICAAAALRISDAGLSIDAVQNMRMQYNLAQTGRFELGERGGGYGGGRAEVQPSMFREPVPLIVGAVAVKAIEAVKGKAPSAAYESGERARLLKMQNLAWIALMAAGTFASALAATGSYRLAMGSLVLAGLMVLRPLAMLDNLFTEICAAALLVAGSGLLLVGVRSGRRRWMAAAGAVFGLLILTKASYLYIAYGLAGSLTLLAAWRAMGWPSRRDLAGVAAFAVCAALVVSPWVIRNAVIFGAPQIAERGGLVLLTRAYHNDLTRDEYIGSFYVWAPKPLRPIFGKVLGYGPKDMQLGGRLQRLNRGGDAFFRDDALFVLDVDAQRAARPDRAISFHRKAGAAYRALVMRAETDGERFPEVVAGQQVTDMAVEMIKAHPVQHLTATLPFLWRGGYFLVVFLAGFFAWTLWRREHALTAFVLPTLGSGAFVALFTHALERYTWGLAPVLAICLVIAGAEAWRLARLRISAARSG